MPLSCLQGFWAKKRAAFGVGGRGVSEIEGLGIFCVWFDYDEAGDCNDM